MAYTATYAMSYFPNPTTASVIRTWHSLSAMSMNSLPP